MRSLGLLLLLAIQSAATVPVPRVFEENRGQADPAVRFISRGSGFQVSLTSNGAILQLSGAPEVRMSFLGSNPAALPEGADALPARVSYLRGRDPSGWVTAVPTYALVRVRELWPSIDVYYRSQQPNLEYDLVLKPGADVRRVRIRFDGTSAVRLDENGDLVLVTSAGEIRQHRPLSFQETKIGRKQVATSFALHGNNTVSFRVGAYDRRLPLTIDPVITYATRFGSPTSGSFNGMAVDAAGNIYFTGGANLDFPTTSTIPGPRGAPYHSTVFVTKIAGDGTLAYSTLIGGDTAALGSQIAVDGAGNAYVAGLMPSNSPDNSFPLTDGAYKTQPPPLSNGHFLLKLNPTGTALVYSTYVDDNAWGIAVDQAGNAVMTGPTTLPDYPTTEGAYQRQLNATGPEPPGAVFVTKMNSSGAGLVYSTFLGGDSRDVPRAISLDSAGNAYVLGSTTSTGFPVTPGSYRSPQDSSQASYVAKLNSEGTALVYSALVGQDFREMYVDAAGNAYLTGSTWDQPQKVAVAKLNAAGTDLMYSTTFGGNYGDSGAGIAVDSLGNAYVVGLTSSPDFPVTPDNSRPCWIFGGGGMFLAKFDPSGSRVSTTIQKGLSSPKIAIDSSGTMYLAGTWGQYSDISGTTNLFPGPAQGNNYLLKLALTDQPPASGPAPWCLADAASLNSFRSVAPGQLVALFGSGIGPERATTSELDDSGRITTSLADTRVIIDGVPAPLLYVHSKQINAVVPYQVAGKSSVTLVVEYKGQRTEPLMLPITEESPAFFSMSSNGRGQGAILNQDGTFNSASNPAEKGSIISIWGTGLGVTDPPSIDGSITVLPLPGQVHGIEVVFGNYDIVRNPRGELLYLGPAPALVAGVFQVNVRVPLNSDSGDVGLGIHYPVDGGYTLRDSHVTVAIR